MPTSKEILDNLDNLRQLINGPLPGARQRRVMFLELYHTLRKGGTGQAIPFLAKTFLGKIE